MGVLATNYFLEALRAEGVSHVFMVPGGLIDPFLPAFAGVPDITPVIAAQEGGAAFMADGYARASGRFGACLVIGGPGITNTVTAMEAARSDGSPVLAVSGQVPTDWEGRGSFQDSSPAALDDLSILRPTCQASYAVDSVHLLRHHLRSCLLAMLAGRQGPAHLSLPLNIQHQSVEAPWESLDPSVYRPALADEAGLERLWSLLLPDDASGAARRVVILAGAGVEKAGAAAELRQLAERYELPVATTLRAKGVLPEDHRLSLGVFGYAGHRHAVEAILSHEADVLLVLGSGLLQRDTMFWDPDMLPRRALVHVDIDPTAIGRTWPAEVPLVGDCRQVLRRLLEAGDPRRSGLEAGNRERGEWLARVRAGGPACYAGEDLLSQDVPLHPARVLAELRRVMPPETVLVVDSGAHRAFCGHYWQALRPGSYLSATNLGPMGWAIPAAVGAKLARPELPMAVVTGDGCMLMHGMEIQAAARYGLAITYVVFNNSALANVWLRASGEGEVPAALTTLPTHDWAGFARSLGLQAETVERPEELRPAFQRAQDSGAACLIDVRCDKRFATPVTPYTKAKQAWVDQE